MYVYFNPNPTGRNTAGDCSIRAVAKALDTSWENAYAKIVVNGFRMGDVPSSNNVWGSVLRMNGFKRANLPDQCPDCYTVEGFAHDHPYGIYVVGTDNHVVTVESGDWFDSWNSKDEVVQYYWYKEGR